TPGAAEERDAAAVAEAAHPGGEKEARGVAEGAPLAPEPTPAQLRHAGAQGTRARGCPSATRARQGRHDTTLCRAERSLGRDDRRPDGLTAGAHATRRNRKTRIAWDSQAIRVFRLALTQGVALRTIE